jgi:hypothetical protein
MRPTRVRQKPLNLTASERAALERAKAKRSAPAQHVQRVKIILMSADGASGREIAEQLGVTEVHVSRTRARFIADRVAGLASRPKAGRKDHAVPRRPKTGSSRWRSRRLRPVDDAADRSRG